MTALTATELAWMRTGNAALFGDTCVRLIYSGTVTRSGDTQPQWTPGATLACRFGSLSGSEQQGVDITKLRYEATLCLAHDATVTYQDRIRLTHYHGEELATPEEFEVVGNPERGPSGLLVRLRRVTA